MKYECACAAADIKNIPGKCTTYSAVNRGMAFFVGMEGSFLILNDMYGKCIESTMKSEVLSSQVLRTRFYSKRYFGTTVYYYCLRICDAVKMPLLVQEYNKQALQNLLSLDIDSPVFTNMHTNLS